MKKDLLMKKELIQEYQTIIDEWQIKFKNLLQSQSDIILDLANFPLSEL